MKVLANDGISKAGADALTNAGFEMLNNKVAQEQLIDFINENKVEVLLVRSATTARKELIDACPTIKIIGRGGVGMDNIDVDYAKEKGIHVINTPASSSKSVAELVAASMFTIARFLHDSNRNMPLEGESKFNDLKKSYSKATEVGGKTLGVIGFGRIGQETVKLGIALGMKVLVYDAFPMKKTLTLDFFDGQKVNFEIETISFDEVITQSDYISLHVPKQKDYVIGAKEMAMMKKGAVLINASRGGIIDEVALVNSLNEEHLGGAALDVFESEPKPEITILMHPQISLTPHIGGNTLEAQDRIGEELAEQIIEIYKK